MIELYIFLTLGGLGYILTRTKSNNINIDLRRDHWIIGGLQTYLMIKYIETYYPNEKYLGRVGGFWLMRAYTLAEIDFNESFWIT